MKKIVLTFLILIAAVGCTHLRHETIKKNDSVKSIIKEFENQIEKDIRDDNINGSISAAIVMKDRIVWSKAFGISDIKRNTPADTNTLYRTASLSKPVTAFLMMLLVQKGIIDLNDPIEKYLPEIRNLQGYSDSTRITFLQL